MKASIFKSGITLTAAHWRPAILTDSDPPGSDMTDGCGFISRYALEVIYRAIGWSTFPTAIQCRIAGSKVHVPFLFLSDRALTHRPLRVFLYLTPHLSRMCLAYGCGNRRLRSSTCLPSTLLRSSSTYCASHNAVRLPSSTTSS